MIAALSSATIVVEAGRRSGALNTAGYALGMGRPVGVVPGPITSAASAGCHRFLRTEPVMCVTSVAEVMQLAFEADGVLELPPPVDDRESKQGGESDNSHVEPTLDPLQVRVVDALRPRRGQSVDELARSVGEGVGAIRSALGVLELDGRAARGVDGLWRRAAAPAVRGECERAS